MEWATFEKWPLTKKVAWPGSEDPVGLRAPKLGYGGLMLKAS